MPEEVELELVIPPVLGKRDQVVAEVRARVERIESAAKRYCLKTGRRILGRGRVLRQSWKGSPSSVAPRRTLRPRFAGRVDARIPALLSYRAFLDAYVDARRTWLATDHAVFPAGTYWLARFAPITLESEHPRSC